MDAANTTYGHRMAKTNGFGLQPGRNMCKQVSKDVVIVFAVLKLEVRVFWWIMVEWYGWNVERKPIS